MIDLFLLPVGSFLAGWYGTKFWMEGDFVDLIVVLFCAIIVVLTF